MAYEMSGAPTDEASAPPDRYEPHAYPASFPALAGTAQLLGGECLLMGWAVRETTGAAAATIELHDGSDATSQLIAELVLSAGQSVRDWLGECGVECRAGVTAVVTAGSVRGVVWLRMFGPRWPVLR